jgi:CrcB protein
MWSKFLLLGVGGFIGSNLRYWISNWAATFLGSYLSYGTLIVNGVGSFILGFLTLYGTEIIDLDPRIRILIGAGMMGALTTFSTFSLETVNFIRESNYYLAFLNVIANVGVGLISVWIGFAVAKHFA